MSLQIGQKLGSYEITALIGKGGMGEVYRARDSRLKRDVAIKILPDEFSLDADRVSRFQREAESLAALNHQNIAAIYDLQQSDATRFLILEFVEGDTLADRIARGPLPVDESLNIGKQICEALEAAHEKGIIHRDLKPANVKITPNGKVKVLDFGLAKAFETEASKANLSQSPTLSMAATNAGLILGTAAYMSPEQARGEDTDARSDVFSCGCVLYEMLAGRQAFQGKTVSDILASVLKVEADWSRLRKDTPPTIRRLLERCLRKDRTRRLQTAADVRIEIEDAQVEPEPGVQAQPAVPLRKRERLVWTSGVAVIVFIAAIFAIPATIHLREAEPDTTAIRSTILPPENTTFDFINGLGLPALSPDGKRIVFGARTADGKVPLWVRPLDGLIAQPLVGTEGATFPFWSPDSRFIAFFQNGKLKKIDASGGPALTLTDAPNGRGGTWSRNSVIVFAPNSNTGSLLRLSSAGGTASPVSMEVGSVPAFLPDGAHFLYQEFTTAAPELPIRVGSLDGSPSKVVGVGSNPLFAQGHLLFLHEGTLMVQPFDAERLGTTGEPVPLAEQVQTTLATGRVGVFSVSGAGQLVYQATSGSSGTILKWFDRKGQKGQAFGAVAPFSELRFSPDGKNVAVCILDRGGSSLWVYDLSRGRSVRLIFDASANEDPVWSPDGSSLIFRSNRKGHGDLYRKGANGLGSEELLYADDKDKIPTSWSPDGKFLLYSTNRVSKTGSDIWALSLAPTEPGSGLKPFPVLQEPFDEREAQFSPDGRWIAYLSNETQRTELYIAPFPPGTSGTRGKRQISTTGAALPIRWRKDGNEVFYVGADQQLMAAEVTINAATLEVGTIRPLFALNEANALGVPRFDASPDGQQFLARTPSEQKLAEPLTLIQNWVAGMKK